MRFLWPDMLWWLLLLPVLVLMYLWLLRRRRRVTLKWASLGLVKEAMGRTSSWRRHLPPLLFLLAIATLLVGLGRPTAKITLPIAEQTLILAMDVSGSMRAADVQPDRLTAAQNAARAFITDLPRNVRVGVVSFAGTAAIVQPPTTSREDVEAAIARFQLQRGTAIGSGIVLSLAALFPDANIDLSEVTGQKAMPAPVGNEAKPEKDLPPMEPGSYSSAAIILLTDGQRTTGPDSMDAAKMAAERGIRVYTVGIGTKEGETIGFEGWTMRVRLDEDTLKNIASATRAEYFYAGTAADLKKVYQDLSARLVLETKETEVTAFFGAAGALLALLSAGLSLLWFHRVL